MTDFSLRQSVVRVKYDGGQTAGAGFVLTDSGLVVTCAHVVARVGSGPGRKVFISFLGSDSTVQASVLPDGWRDPNEDDLAFLQIDQELPQGVAAVVLGFSHAAAGHRFLSFGFPRLQDEQGQQPFEGVWAKGEVIELLCRRTGQTVLQLSSFELEQGHSGAPVFDLSTNRVVGIVTDVGQPDPRKKQQFLAWATPAENIVNAHPEVAIRGGVALRAKLRPYFAHVLYEAQHFTGRKTQLRALDRFWNRGEGGVLSLVGIGGAGKTAIVRHFLELQGWLDPIQRPDYPDGLFVWSFYDDPDIMEFITQAYLYFSQSLDGGPDENVSHNGQRANVYMLTNVLERADGRFLLVLDGLEKVQSDGTSFNLERGKLVDAPLRSLLSRIADGICGQTKAIVTSRFPLTDLAVWSGSKYKEIDVDQLEKLAARALLRKLGVIGPQGALDYVAEEYGSHALTLDLLGRLLAEYYDGNAWRARQLPTLEVAAGTPMVDKQAHKLARVLAAYESKLSALELQTMQYLSVFRRPISFELFQEVYLGHTHLTNAGLVARTTPEDLRSVVHVLAARRLVILEKSDGEEYCTAHPAVRDHFYIHLAERETVHDAVRSRLATLVDAPGYIKPLDAKALGLIEELIYHTIQLGKTREAYEIYRDRLGYLHLGWNLGDHVRGAGIARSFQLEDGQEVGDIQQYDWERLTMDYALYLKNMGLLDESISFFSQAADRERKKEISAKNAALALQNLSAVQVLRGLLPAAEVAAREALDYSSRTQDIRLVQDCRVRLATALALQGRSDEAESVFQTVRSLLTKERKEDFPRDLPGIRLGWLLMHLGRVSEAMTILTETRDISEHFGFKIICARADVLIAEGALRTGQKTNAVQAINRVHSWASSAYDQEMVVAVDLISAWLALAERQLTHAMHNIRDGLRVAEECGHSVYWIDLKLAEGYVNLAARNVEAAEACARDAIVGRGSRRGRGRMFGAEQKECGYLWGQVDALHLLAEVLTALGRHDVAVEGLQKAKAIQARLKYARLAETEVVIGALASDSHS